MLVLSRRLDEDLVIGEGPGAVRVRVCGIRKEKVRLGVIAPDDVRIDRGEVRLEREAGAVARASGKAVGV